MKIETSILPRKDGTVRLGLPSGKTAVFQDDDGVLVCDIQDDADIAHALNLEGFYPQDDGPGISKEDLLATARALGIPVTGRMSYDTLTKKIAAAQKQEESAE